MRYRAQHWKDEPGVKYPEPESELTQVPPEALAGIVEAVGWEGAARGGRMVALVTSPIWEGFLRSKIRTRSLIITAACVCARWMGMCRG